MSADGDRMVVDHGQPAERIASALHESFAQDEAWDSLVYRAEVLDDEGTIEHELQAVPERPGGWLSVPQPVLLTTMQWLKSLAEGDAPT